MQVVGSYNIYKIVAIDTFTPVARDTTVFSSESTTTYCWTYANMHNDFWEHKRGHNIRIKKPLKV